MKRIAIVILLALVAAGAWGQDLAGFQEGFDGFATALAPTLSYNATAGNNWSDAYIGNFPRFGVGAAVGFTSVPVDKLDALIGTIGTGVEIPEALSQLGLPVPAAALSAKIGGFVLPFDIGLKAMMLTPEMTASFDAMGFSFDYSLFGGNVRYALVKQNLLLPDVSIGAGYNRLSGAISMPLDIAGQSFTFNDGTLDHTLAVSDPDLALAWTTDSFDFTVQASKKILFIEPYVGAGLSVGKSTVRGGIESQLTYDGAAVTEDQVQEIKDALEAAEITVPDLSADGFMFGSEDSSPAFRVYGGLSLSLFVIKLDTSVTYAPASQSLGAQVMLRLQF